MDHIDRRLLAVEYAQGPAIKSLISGAAFKGIDSESIFADKLKSIIGDELATRLFCFNNKFVPGFSKKPPSLLIFYKDPLDKFQLEGLIRKKLQEQKTSDFFISDLWPRAWLDRKFSLMTMARELRSRFPGVKTLVRTCVEGPYLAVKLDLNAPYKIFGLKGMFPSNKEELASSLYSFKDFRRMQDNGFLLISDVLKAWTTLVCKSSMRATMTKANRYDYSTLTLPRQAWHRFDNAGDRTIFDFGDFLDEGLTLYREDISRRTSRNASKERSGPASRLARDFVPPPARGVAE